MRLKELKQICRQSLEFAFKRGADVLGFSFKDQHAVLIGDAAGEVQPDFFGDGGPDFDAQDIIVFGHGLIAQPAFDDREDGILLLPLEKGAAEMAEEFTARGLQQVEVAAIIDMVADSAFGVSDAVLVAKNGRSHGMKSNEGIYDLRYVISAGMVNKANLGKISTTSRAKT